MIVLVVMVDYAEKEVYWLEVGHLIEVAENDACAAATLITETEIGALFDVVAHLTLVRLLAYGTKSLHAKSFVMEIDGHLQTVVGAAAGLGVVAVVGAKASTAVINEAAYPEPDFGDEQLLQDARTANSAGAMEGSEEGVGHVVEVNC